MADSGARMQAFECPICAPKRYFVTEIGLRTHVADRHPWRSLPPTQRRLNPTSAVLPEPAWLRERQANAAASVYQPYYEPRQHPVRVSGGGGPANNALVTFETQSQLSDDVFEETGLGGGNAAGGVGTGGGGRTRGFVGQPAQQQRYLQSQRQYHQKPYAQPQHSDDEYPPPDYDVTPLDLARSVDAIDSSARKRRELVTSRRPWYDSEDYAGPRNLMEKTPGGYFDDRENDDAAMDGDRAGGYSRHRMRHEIEERDSRIETLRLEIDRLWDERMRLLKREADGIRAVKDQGGVGLYWEGSSGGANVGRRGQGFPVDPRQSRRAGHAFQPVQPHSRLQLYRQQQQQQYFDGRRAMDY